MRAGALGALLATPALAQEAPWSDPALGPTSPRFQADRFGLTVHAEYRAAAIAVDDLDLAARDVAWFEQRLRLGAELDRDERLRLVAGADVLDGLFGAAGGTPDSGARVLESPPGTQRLAVGFTGPGEPTDRRAYDLVIVPTEPVALRRAYLELVSGVGILRIGRMPVIEGTSIIASDGESGKNRFGVSGAGDSVERVQLSLKPLEPLNAEVQADPRGVRIMAHYDRLAASDPRGASAANRVGLELSAIEPRPAERRWLDARARASLAWSRPSATDVGLLGAHLSARAEQLGIGAESVFLTGGTRRESESLAALVPQPPARQRIEQWGTRVVARWDERRFTAYVELDYASGDRSPAPESKLQRFDFARDANVGLLLFERVLAHESGRSAAAGAARLTELGAGDTFAADRAETRGAFTGAFALFPQLDLRPIEPLLVRAGALFAWAPDGLADPVLSLTRPRLAGDPVELADPVGYRGGPIDGYLGTELDGRVGWRYEESFRLEAEGAVLLPGRALEDARGRASTSSFVSLRAELAF